MLQVPDWDKPKPRVVDESGLLLLDAVAYLRKHGHCQNAFKTPEGQVCAYTALLQSAIQRYGSTIHDVMTPEFSVWSGAIERLCRLTPTGTIIEWNDVTPTSEVLRTMQEAAWSG